MTTTETVHDRIGTARNELTTAQLLAVFALAAALLFTLLFLQEPLAHDSMHNFRHAAGVVCH
ncbi:CbtB domain-containing protein [Natrinema longum]|uniref:CbtB-domain containing protein n=1 Tax=Natrinema longum TaxID=370324 RepID=A0A8A2UDD6_9EURY|nr:CbtB domain-containing protein [Natrinema longum]MBZ6495833.1 CbtB-domain containing protein [Natrinema longum]QSW86225.1 CbtB-domain containing protein [Natrinema longum]